MVYYKVPILYVWNIIICGLLPGCHMVRQCLLFHIGMKQLLLSNLSLFYVAWHLSLLSPLLFCLRGVTIFRIRLNLPFLWLSFDRDFCSKRATDDSADDWRVRKTIVFKLREILECLIYYKIVWFLLWNCYIILWNIYGEFN